MVISPACSKHRQLLVAKTLVPLLLLLVAAAPCMRADEKEDLDAYKVRIDALWFYSQPSVHFHGTVSQGDFDFERDASFNSYHTGTVKLDWKFTRKNHLYFGFLPLNQSKEFTLNRTIVFQGQTYGAGLAADARLQTYLFVPGYQYDIIRRKQGHLGLAVQLDLLYIKGSLKAAAQTLNGTQRFAQSSSSTVRAPLPVAGPEFRYYLIPNSNRLFVAGNLFGMYFFGYGNFISSYGTLGISLSKHLNLQGGYQLGSRFTLKSKTDRIGLELNQAGAIAGLEVSF